MPVRRGDRFFYAHAELGWGMGRTVVWLYGALLARGGVIVRHEV